MPDSWENLNNCKFAHALFLSVNGVSVGFARDLWFHRLNFFFLVSESVRLETKSDWFEFIRGKSYVSFFLRVICISVAS